MKTNSAFTLIETMVSIAVGMIGILGTVQGYVWAARTTKREATVESSKAKRLGLDGEVIKSPTMKELFVVWEAGIASARYAKIVGVGMPSPEPLLNPDGSIWAEWRVYSKPIDLESAEQTVEFLTEQ